METTASIKEDLQLVGFKLGNEEYAINIMAVQEINRISGITPIPNSPDYVEGVINLRGKVIPVLNLRKKLQFPDIPRDDSSRIIIVEVSGVTRGLIVDAVTEVLRISPDVIAPPPQTSSDLHGRSVMGLARLDKRLIILLDVDKMLADAE